MRRRLVKSGATRTTLPFAASLPLGLGTARRRRRVLRTSAAGIEAAMGRARNRKQGVPSQSYLFW